MFFVGYFFCIFFYLAPTDRSLPSILSLSLDCRRRNRHIHLLLLHETSILKVVRSDRESTLEGNKGKSGAVQGDLEEIHLLGRQMVIGVDIGEAPLESEGDKIGLSGQNGSKLEAILVENGHLPGRTNLSGSVVKGTRGALAAEHGLAEAGVRGAIREAATVVGVLSCVEGADGAVEEGTLRVRARVVSAAVGNARLGEGVLKEGDDLGRHDVGDEVRDLLLRHVARRHGGTYLVVPGVVVRHHEGVDEVHVDHLLVGSRRVGPPEGGDLLHGSVEKGGIGLGQARLNCGHFSRFWRVGTGQKKMWKLAGW